MCGRQTATDASNHHLNVGVCFVPFRPQIVLKPGSASIIGTMGFRKYRFLVVTACFFSFIGHPVVHAENVNPSGEVYRLRLYHLHTGERADITYRVGNEYLANGVAQLNHFLRDHRTGDVKSYDPREFDLLHDLMVRLGHPDGLIDIVCGYRTPWSNNYLREHGHGVALHSQHMEAKAIDIRIPGVATSQVRDAALAMQRGGVGYYAASDFVHVDVGRVRRW
jgi:uncharacterized protein YcbK (DUF882 family)